MSVAAAFPEREPIWHVGDSMDRVRDALAGRVRAMRAKPSGGLVTNCVNPGHPDNRPSLSVDHVTTEWGGRVLFHCHACGDGPTSQDWAAWLGLDYDDLFDDRRWSVRHRPGARPTVQRATAATYGRLGKLPAPISQSLPELLGQAVPVEPVGREHKHSYQTVTTYLYLDTDGVPVHRVHRQGCRQCGEKSFPQEYLRVGGDSATAGDWCASVASAGRRQAGWLPRLYRQAQVELAVADGVPVWILEGEKDVHTAEGEALVATTNPGGATNFAAHFAAVFTGAAQVNVVVDRDGAGWERAVRIHALLTHPDVGVGRVRLLLPATLGEKSDFTDHIEAGYGVDDLVEMPVAAFQAWALLGAGRAVEQAFRSIETATVEAAAQLQVAAADEAAGRVKKAAERRRFAQRWAKEAAVQHAKLVGIVQQVADHTDSIPDADPGRAWAEEAVEIGRHRLTVATGLTREVYASTQLAVPATITQAVITRTARPVQDPPGRPDLQVLPGGGGGGSGYSEPIEAPRFEVLDGQLVEVVYRPGRDGELRRHNKLVLNTEIYLVAKEVGELDNEVDTQDVDLFDLGDRDGRQTATVVRELPTITHVLLHLPGYGPDGGSTVRVPHKEFMDGSYLAHLPVPDLWYQPTPQGKSKVFQAIMAVSQGVSMTTSYRATGWRRRPDGSWMYIHAGGAIDADGFVPITTNLTGPLARFDLPNPTCDPDRLREAFVSGTADLIDAFPDRVTISLVAHAFRACLTANPWLLMLNASPGTGKTGLAALVMHYYGETWDRNRPLSSMSGNGATDNALRIMAHGAKDTVAFLDDGAPTDGHLDAVKRIERVTRLFHNQESRTRADRTGQEMRDGGGPRSSAIMTTELPPRAGSSGGRRAYLVPLDKHDITIADIRRLDAWTSRHRRALLMASFIRWVAEHRIERIAQMRALTDAFRDLCENGPLRGNAHIEKVAELWPGWVLLLQFLREQGALDAGEARRWAQRGQEALLVAAEACDDPDLPSTTSSRARDLLLYALNSGVAYAADAHTGHAPPYLQSRLGWRDTSTLPGEQTWVRNDPRAIAIGHVNFDSDDGSGPELMCRAAEFEAVLKSAAASMLDTTGFDLATVFRALREEGTLKTREEHRGGRTIMRHTLDRTIWCLESLTPGRPLREKRVVLDLAALLGDTNSGEGDTPPEGPPTPPAGGSGDTVPASLGFFDDAPETDPGTEDHPTPTGRTDEGETTPVAGPVADRDGIDDSTRSPMFPDRYLTNDGGLTLAATTPTDRRPCIRCGVRCGVQVVGLFLHTPCFEATTATTMAQLRDELGLPDTVVPVPSPTPAPPEPAVAPLMQPAVAATGLATRDGSAARPVPEIVASHPRKSPARRPEMVFRAVAAVVDVDHYVLPDGTRAPLPYPIEHLGHLEQLGRDLGLGAAPVGWRTMPEPGLIVPTRAVWARLGVDVDTAGADKKKWLEQVSHGLAAITDAQREGWVFGRGGSDPVRLNGIIRLRRAGESRGQIRIMLRVGMNPEYGVGFDVDDAAVARRLQLFTDATGASFAAGTTALGTGLDLLEACTSRQVRDLLEPVSWQGVAPAGNPTLEAQFNFTRTPFGQEADEPWIAFFDRSKSYLAGWSSILLGCGAPTHLDRETAPIRFDGKQAGWWRITLPENTIGGIQQHQLFPHVLDPAGTAGGQQRWVTTPALDYAIRALDVVPAISEAWVWPQDRSKRALNGFYERIRDAVTKLADLPAGPDTTAATTMVQACYKELSGYFTSQNAMQAKSALHQPYWFHATIAQARVGMLHQILTIGHSTGRWPLVVANTDLIGYAASEIHPQRSWPGEPKKLGRTPGSYKLTRYAAMADHLPYLTGGNWRGHDHTTRFDPDTPVTTPPAAGGSRRAGRKAGRS